MDSPLFWFLMILSYCQVAFRASIFHPFKNFFHFLIITWIVSFFIPPECVEDSTSIRTDHITSLLVPRILFSLIRYVLCDNWLHGFCKAPSNVSWLIGRRGGLSICLMVIYMFRAIGVLPSMIVTLPDLIFVHLVDNTHGICNKLNQLQLSAIICLPLCSKSNKCWLWNISPIGK